jgi:hypothetical protein
MQKRSSNNSKKISRRARRNFPGTSLHKSGSTYRTYRFEQLQLPYNDQCPVLPLRERYQTSAFD